MSTTRMFTIVVASGSSTRFGSDKLKVNFGFETVLERTVRIAKESSDGVVLVVGNPAEYEYLDVDFIVEGGSTRTQSVKNGLNKIPDGVEIIAVQDGARPAATKELYEKGRKIIETGNVAAIPVIEVVDTIKKIDENDLISTLDRSKLKAAQTPQIFDATTLRIAHNQNIEDTDDAALVEALGEKIILFEGLVANKKITLPSDLPQATPSKKDVTRIGIGYDIHPFATNQSKKLILAGIEIDHIGLEGHSDADAVFHAVTDAILSAIGAPDLGTLFSVNNEKYKDASSNIFLSESVRLARNDSYVIGNISIVINAQKPKLSDYLDDMKKRIAEIIEPISTPDTAISITPKHGEGIGDIGQAKAISVYCTALLTQQEN